MLPQRYALKEEGGPSIGRRMFLAFGPHLLRIPVNVTADSGIVTADSGKPGKSVTLGRNRRSRWAGIPTCHNLGTVEEATHPLRSPRTSAAPPALPHPTYHTPVTAFSKRRLGLFQPKT